MLRFALKASRQRNEFPAPERLEHPAVVEAEGVPVGAITQVSDLRRASGQ